MEKVRPQVFAGLNNDQLKGKAGHCFLEAARTQDPSERLAFLQYASGALHLADLTVEDLGLEISDVIRVANRSYHGSALEASAIHQIATEIILSFPRSPQ